MGNIFIKDTRCLICKKYFVCTGVKCIKCKTFFDIHCLQTYMARQTSTQILTTRHL